MGRGGHLTSEPKFKVGDKVILKVKMYEGKTFDVTAVMLGEEHKYDLAPLQTTPVEDGPIGMLLSMQKVPEEWIAFSLDRTRPWDQESI